MLDKYFDKISCINLIERIEKWKTTKNQLIELGFTNAQCEEIRFDAIDGNSISNDSKKLSNGEVACFKSHIEVIRKAKESKAKSVLILEDDVVFDFDFKEKFPIFFEQVPIDWDFIYIGSITTNKDAISKMIRDNVCKINRVYGLHCLAIKNVMFDLILENAIVENVDIPIDNWYVNNLHMKHNCYAFIPSLAQQLTGYSDNKNKDVTYTYL